MSDLSLGVTVGGVGEAVTALQRVGQATNQAAGTAADAATQNQALGTSAEMTARRIQGMAGQVASLSTRLGGGAIGQAAGLVGSLAGVTANAMAMGATMGPAGVVVGAISGLLPLLADFIGSTEDVTHATSAMTDAQRDFSIEAANSVDAINDLVAAQQRLAHQRSEQALIDQGLGSVDQQFAAAELAGQRVGTLTQQRAELIARIHQIQTSDFAQADQLAGLEQQRYALTVQINEAHEESQRLGRLAIEAENDERDIQNDLVTTAMDAANASERHARGARATADAMQDVATATADAAASEQSFIAEMMRAAQVAREQAANERSLARHGSIAAPRDANGDVALPQIATSDDIAALATGTERAATSATRAATAVRSLTAAQRELAATSHPVNAALGSVANTIGGTFTNALQSSVSAWLDGSKSFVQAAEAMAKGVLKALVTEAIVQGVVELARGIADIASYRYDSGAEHFAAAAAWAAVGVVAGGVGAAVGAFGGGGASAGGGATTRDTASASREAQSQQQQGPMVFNIYPGGYITKADVAAGLVDALNAHSRTQGGSLSPRIMRAA